MSTLVDFIYYKLQLSLKRRRGFMYEGCIYTKSWSPEEKYYFIWSLFPSTIIVNSQSLMTMLLVSHLKKYLSDQSWKSILIIASCCACLPTLWYLFFFFFFLITNVMLPWKLGYVTIRHLGPQCIPVYSNRIAFNNYIMTKRCLRCEINLELWNKIHIPPAIVV